MASNLEIPLPEESITIVKRHGASLCDIIATKFGCVATIEGVDLDNEKTSYQRPPPTISPVKKFEYMMSCGVTVSVWKADLTTFQADAVVNAANDQLQHYGGLALALSKAGGPRIQQESDDYVRRHGDLTTGDAVVFEGWSLPSKKIIHAVGPYLPTDPSQSDLRKAQSLLEKAIRSILNRVEEHRVGTVAIPAISSGLFHYPLSECARTIVSTIKRHYEQLSPQSHRPKEIFLANHDDPTVQEMENACRKIFNLHQYQPQQQPSYSHVAKNTRSAANNQQPSLQIGSVLLTLKKGRIEEQHTDVIVNTASRDKELKVGKISSAILNKAGYDIQREISKAERKGFLIRTKGYKLHCKEVFHTFCTDKGLDSAADQILYSSVLECLWAAVQTYKSITFPAIGTGALRFSKEESASIMLRAVSDFAQKSLNKLEVYFVIYPMDHETFQAFEWQIGMYQQRSTSASFSVGWYPEITGTGGQSRHNSPHQHPPAYPGTFQGYPQAEAPGPKDDSHASRAQIPHISLHGASVESQREAERWLRDRIFKRSHSIKICNNFISHFSEDDHRRLSRLAKNGLTIEEFLTQGHACLEINGELKEDVAVAALKVEATLCEIQKKFIREEELELQTLSQTEPSCKRETVEQSSREFSKRSDAFNGHKLRVTKVLKVENAALKTMFDLKKKQLQSSTSKPLIQRIPAQFCDMISRIGFQAECAPPEDPEYGEGIYFTHTVTKALEVWKEKAEEYLYFVEAEVLLGNSGPGKPGLILPPPVGSDPNVLYDSVTGKSDVSVVFSGYQALPKYIVVCRKY